ncbi:hypothetical protein C4J89_0825 [Pseudomonas sp. R4-35-07]|uniref:hypothetical protein n=1 Tax=Pseudomonas sp. R4-35-07 TaxID=658643 RepID=UPI000F5617B5|nr:hypothetical protein [Pseudomonas sp. R4-35-07]AZF30316.1 hypothetical protein C4J89_0825 [Pseudomonas sp. R4-35-07]
MVKVMASNLHFSATDLDMLPITDLASFSRVDDSAVLIDLLQDTVGESQAHDIAMLLPDHYKAIYLRKDIVFIKANLQESLRPHLAPELLHSLMNELCSAMDLFSLLTRDEKPLVSLRMVTEEYVARSIRPSASITTGMPLP